MKHVWPTLLSMAFDESAFATCKRLKVGAVIAHEGSTLSTGFNTASTGDDTCLDVGCKVVKDHCVRTVHAEQVAILECAKSGNATEGTEIFVSHFPCLRCCKDIIGAGIKKVHYAHDYKNDPYALELFEKAGVEVIQYTRE
jgi:dCMP deaminase